MNVNQNNMLARMQKAQAPFIKPMPFIGKMFQLTSIQMLRLLRGQNHVGGNTLIGVYAEHIEIIKC